MKKLDALALLSPTARRRCAAILALPLLFGGTAVQMPAVATATTVTSQQQGWSTRLHMARTASNQLVLQLNVLNKPVTRYANAVYVLYARQNNQWVQVFTSVGARLIPNANDNIILAPEVINLRDLAFGRNADLAQMEFKAVAMLRYDARGERRDQLVQIEQVKRYSGIAQTSTFQIANNSGEIPGIRQEQSQFSLAIVQRQQSSSHVTARISLKEKRSNGFLPEKFVGDFRYKLQGKQQAKFVNGMKAGDRVVVRLFDKKRQFIGYSEFELLANNMAVTLVLPDRAADYGTVRTVYGIDTNQDLSIDRRAIVYDYFTRVTRVRNVFDARVSFFSSTQSFDVSRFTVSGLPAIARNCSYPPSLQIGAFMLTNQVFSAFTETLSVALTSLPGQVVQSIDLSNRELLSFEVSQLITDYQSIVVTPGRIDREIDDDDDNDDDDKKPRKRHCNQGIGNGSEGCDPGKSRPRGGSNDEGGSKRRR